MDFFYSNMRVISILLLTILLGACGGGGEEGITPSNTGSTGNDNPNTSTPTSITISYTNPSDYVWGTLATGQTVYIDRSYTYSNIPSEYEGFKVLKTANDDKASSGNSFISFDIDNSATIYIAHVADETNLPAWLAVWNKTGMIIATTDRNLNVYSKEFAAGTVVLGGNEGVASMYTVIVAAPGDGGTGEVPPEVPPEVGIGTASLSWTPPTTNVDGSTLEDLAGYRIYYGTQEGTYPNMIPVSKGVSSYVVENLAPNTYFFVITAYDYWGNESGQSNVATKTITQ